MKTFKNKINELLSKAEVVEQSIDNLTTGIRGLRKNGGVSKLFIYENGLSPANTTTTELSDHVLELFLNDLVAEYDRILLNTQKEINAHFSEKNIKFRILDNDDKVIKENLSYRLALDYIENNSEKSLKIEPMLEGD